MKLRASLALALLNLSLVVGLGAVARVTVPRLDLTNLFLLGPAQVSAAFIATAYTIFCILVYLPLLTVGLALSRSASRGRDWLSAGIATVILLPPALWVAFGDSLAAREERRVELAWARTLGPMSVLAARYPAESASEGAVKLAAAVARIGIDLDGPKGTAPHPSEPDRAAFAGVAKELWTFVSSQTNKADDTLEVPTSALAAWLSLHQRDVAALVGQVRRGGRIAFPTDWSRFGGPLPPGGGLRETTCVLILFALEQERAGDSAAAAEAIEASWRVGASLRERGDLFSQWAASVLDAMTLSALRKLRKASTASTSGMVNHDYRASLLRAIEMEAWAMSRLPKETKPGARTRAAEQWARKTIYAPYVRLMASNYSDTLRKTADELTRNDPCLVDAETVDRRAEQSLAWWNIFGRASLGHNAARWVTAVRTALAQELTLEVLTLRALEKEQGAWPTELPGLESAVCPGRRWDYATSADGQVSLQLDLDAARGGPLAFRATRPRTGHREPTLLPPGDRPIG